MLIHIHSDLLMEKDLQPALLFLFQGLRWRGHTLEFRSTDELGTHLGDFLLLKKNKDGFYPAEDREDLIFLEKKGANYCLSMSGDIHYPFSPVPNLDFYQARKEEGEERNHPRTILILWFTEDEEMLTECLLSMEMIASSLPRIQLMVLTMDREPLYKPTMPSIFASIYQIYPEELLKMYSRSYLCLGLVKDPFHLEEVLSCDTPVITIGDEIHPQIPSVSAKALEIAVISLKIMKIGQISSRLVQEGKSILQNRDFSSHLSQIESLLEKKIQSRKERSLTGGDKGGEPLPSLFSDEFEEKMLDTSFALKRTLFQILAFFQGKKRGPF